MDIAPRPDRSAPGPAGHDALPVAIDLADRDLAAAVTAHVESVLGWQVISPGPHLAPRLRLAGAPAPAGPAGSAQTPTVVIAWADDVGDDVGPGAAAPDVRWPDDAGRLPDLVPPATAARPRGPVLRVAGAAGGVGASTTALALGALLSWAGRPAVVLTDEAGLSLTRLPAGGGALPGAGGLQVCTDQAAALRCGAVVVADGPPHDAPVAGAPHVLVGRPDARLLRALADPATHRTAVVVVGAAGLHAAELARAVGSRPHVAVPWSTRVARAGLRGRVPDGLPGRWLAALGPVLRTTTALGRGRVAA